MRGSRVFLAIVFVITMVTGLGSTCLWVEASSKQVESLELNNRNPQENIPFEMTNLFPGDSKTQFYRVSVSYTGTIAVCFQAIAKAGEEKLGEVLNVRVRLKDSDEVLYEGRLSDMSEQSYVLKTDSESKTLDLCYEVTVSLSTEVGNEYQNKCLAAELMWWAEADPPKKEEDGGETDPPKEVVGENGIAGSAGSGSLVAPDTGDYSRPILYQVVIISSVILLVWMIKCQGKVSKSKGRLTRGILLVVFWVSGFSITTLALILQKVTVEDNLFVTGNVSVDLNNGEPIFDKDMLFEPGMVVEEEFTLRNESSCDVYYRLYFSTVGGELAESLEVTLKDGENTIFCGTLAEMKGKNAEGADGFLKEDEERKMIMTFCVPEDCDNRMRGRAAWFDLKADVVQAVNNPSQSFGK